MANIPNPRSWPQIFGDSVATFLSRSGLKSLKAGSPILSLLETATQSDMRQSQDIFGLLKSVSLDNAEGAALVRIGNDEQVPKITKKPSSGFVNIIDTSITKRSTKIYQGQAAPIVGSTTIYIVDGSTFPNTGSVYLGRGTSNYEGPIAYSAVTAVPNPTSPVYWTLSLSAPTARFHNLNETVILSQGGLRIVTPSDIVQTPQGNLASAVQFSPLYSATIPDGEVEVDNVQVVCTQPGTIGNVPSKAISQFSTTPFAGCSVTNPLPFTNGLADESDDDYRERIRGARQTRTKGTALAIQTYVLGAVSPDENKSIISASLVSRTGFPTTLYIDDGTGYEEKSAGVAIETLEDLAAGGDSFFEVASDRPVAKCSVTATVAAPYNLTAGMSLSVKVGGVTTTHTFSSSEFRAINNASAYEVSSAINGDASLLWSARTAGSGSYVVLTAKSDTHEDLQVISGVLGVDSNYVFLFPTTPTYTTMLYKNDRLLSKDGRLASCATRSFSNWSSFTGSQTLVISVDGIPIVDGSSVTGGVTDKLVTFVSQDFIDAATGYSTVGLNSLTAWAAVFNRRLPGITAAVSGGVITLTSNKGTNSTAKIAITGGTLVTNGMFSLTSVAGANSDYVLDRNVGEIKLSSLLSANDKLTLGSLYTRAFCESSTLSTVSLTSPANLWFSVDGAAYGASSSIIQSGNAPLAITATAQKYGYRLRIAAQDGVSKLFSNVQTGDWAIFWDNQFNGDIRASYRVAGVDAGSTYFEFDKQDMQLPVAGHTLTSLDGVSGRFLIAGGWTTLGSNAACPSIPAAGCMIYDSASKTFIEAAPMSIPRVGHTAVLIAGNKVLVVGGSTNGFDSGVTATAEIYDPATNTWSAALDNTQGVWYHNSLLLNSGEVIVIGGRKSDSTVTASCTKYNVGGNTWSAAGTLAVARSHAMAVLLNTSDVLCVGGQSAVAVLASGEFYNSGTNAWSATGTSLSVARQSGAISLLNSGNVIVAGGATSLDGAIPTNSAVVDLYTTGGAGVAGTFGVNGNSLTTPRSYMGFCTTPAGRTVLVGGFRTTFATHAEQGSSADNSAWTAAVGLPTGLFTRAYCKLARVGGENVVVTGGATVVGTTTEPLACSEQYDPVAKTFSLNDPNIIASVTLTNSGLSFVRTAGLLQQVVVPIGTNYTASSLSSIVSSGLQGAGSSVYQTNKYRISTNSFDQAIGDIGLVAADVPGQMLGQTVSSSIVNLVGHLASMESGGSTVGTPDFHISYVKGSAGPNKPVVLLDSGYSTTFFPYPDTQLTGLREIGPSLTITRYGTNKLATAPISSLSTDGSLLSVVLGKTFSSSTAVSAIGGLVRTGGNTVTATTSATHGFAVGQLLTMSPGEAGFEAGDKVILSVPSSTTFTYTETGGNGASTAQQTFTLNPSAVRRWNANSRAYFASTLAIGPDDALSVLIDGNTSQKQFGMNMWRKLSTVGTTYALQNTFKDADAGNVSLAVTFGLSYLFNDFAVYMPARTKTHDADNTKRVLWRYVRLGPDGNKARVRYTLPAAPNSVVGVSVDNLSNDWTNCSITLAGGAARTGYIVRTTTKVGVAATSETNGIASTKFVFGLTVSSAQRTTNVTTLTLTLPAGVTDHGIQVNDTFYFNSTDVNFASGVKTVTARAATTINYADVAADAGPDANPGTISRDNADVTLAGASIIVGDFIRFGSTSGLGVAFKGTTMRITAFANQLVTGSFEGLPPSNVSTTIAWNPLNDVSALTIFQNPAQTATAISAAVTALSGTNKSCPITGTVVGTGAGTIDRSSAEEASVYPTWFNLTDGYNFVGVTTAPGSIAGDYQLTFKLPITSSLAANSDWDHETVKICPITAGTVANWLSTPCVSGLFTSAQCVVSSAGSKVQISSFTAGTSGSVQVLGGTSNYATATVIGTSQLTASILSSAVGGAVVRTGGNVVTVTTGQLHGLAIGSIFNFFPGEANFATGNKTVATVISPTSFTYNEPGVNAATASTETMIPVQYPVVTVAASAASGFIAGRLLRVDNTFSLPKSGVFVSDSKISSINADGTFAFDNGHAKVWDVRTAPSTNVMLHVENQSGWMAYTDSGLGSALTASNVVEGDWVRIIPPAAPGAVHQMSTANLGIFRVVRVGTSREGFVTFWVENKDASGLVRGVDDLPAECDVQFIQYNSVMPGDTIKISTSVWGVNNVGDWKVVSVGTVGGVDFTYPTGRWTFKVDISSKTPQAIGAVAILGANSSLVQCIEKTPTSLIKRIMSITPNASNGALVDIKLRSSAGYDLISAGSGSILTALDKLRFPVGIATGIDGYRHNTGLIAIANKIVWGDPTDPQTYPGTAAAASIVNIAGPIVKRLSFSIIARARSGAPLKDIEAKIKSAVAAIVNRAGVGQSISLSDVVKAVSKVGGVTAVTIQYPIYGVGNDLITVQPYERPRILDLDEDVKVSFVGQ